MAEHAATCGGCGCLCDDVTVVTAGERLERTVGTCPRGAAWFADRAALEEPAARVDGRPADPPAALDAAAAVLAAARLPLVYGLGQTSCEAQREAVALAERLGAVVDPAGGVLDGAAGAAAQEIGSSTATFGEIRDRAELVVAWRADPVATHPRLLGRLRLDRAGRAGRTLVAVGAPGTATAAEADEVVALAPGADLEALWTLRALVRGAPLARAPDAALPRLAGRLRACRVAAFLHHDLDGAAALGLHELVRECSRQTHVVALGLRREGNAAGAEDVLAWQTGYPSAVSFAGGHPRADPGELGAAALLARGAPDAALVVASDPLGHLPAAAARHLRRIPTVVVGAGATATAAAARVSFATATAGVHRAGTAHRMDGVPLPLRAPLPADRPDDADILAAIGARLEAR